MKRIAIIGAGLAGLTLASALKSRAAVTVFEKSRGVGGRMATRRAGGYQFDHGAQFFTARTAAFQALLSPLVDEGVIAEWNARFAELERDNVTAARRWNGDPKHYIAVPGMTALAKRMATGADIRLRTQVARIRRTGRDWELQDDCGAGLGAYDWVISTLPAAQAASLLPSAASFAAALGDVDMLGCFALLLGFRSAPSLDWDAALVHGADISWISVDSSKPGRAGGFSLVVQSTNAWADAHIDDPLDNVEAHLASELREVVDVDALNADYRSAHRWRYANAAKRGGADFLIDTDLSLAACGDWCIRGRVEAAYNSAMSLAQRIEESL